MRIEIVCFDCEAILGKIDFEDLDWEEKVAAFGVEHEAKGHVVP